MDNERGGRRRLTPGLMGAILASAALKGRETVEPTPDDFFGQPVSKPSRWISRSSKMTRPSHSKYSCHQGKKECARRLKQQARLAA